MLPRTKIYRPPIGFGPMGHTLSLICRNIFHEHGVFHGYSDEKVKELYAATKTASERYFKEVSVLENFLGKHSCEAIPGELNEEQEMMAYITTPAQNGNGVLSKAVLLLDEFIPKVVERRRGRLKKLIEKLRFEGTPDVFQNIRKEDIALHAAYQALQKPKPSAEVSQDALMILAVRNWKPRKLPEYLPIRRYHTVATIRTIVLKSLTDAELFIYRHQQVCWKV